MRLHAGLVLTLAMAWSLESPARDIGDERALTFHVDQADIDNGHADIGSLIEVGRHLFSIRFTSLDGAGRPGATGSGAPQRRPLINTHRFLRTSGPDSNSCAGCHNSPEPGGFGDFVSNVFVGAQEREPVLLSVSPEFSAERGTPPMHGSGYIELLAREMTTELLSTRAAAVAAAARTREPVRVALSTKGVDFGFLTAHPNGKVDTVEVQGVDKDLVIRPWSQKGVVTSLRTFTVTALNHHHGIQANERFGIDQTGDLDFDGDGVELEFTEGDVTALTLFQAALPPPTQIVPDYSVIQTAVANGSKVFEDIGCGECHRSTLVLNDPTYTEPGPYNLEGTLRLKEVTHSIRVDLTTLHPERPFARTEDGGIRIPVFTDLKRHKIADEANPFFGNEIVDQGFAATHEFLTARLWGVGSTGPYGHRGDVTTLREVIVKHGGEAARCRDRFLALDRSQQAEVIEFLKTLQIEAPRAVLAAAERQQIFDRFQARWHQALAGELPPKLQAIATRAEAATTRARRSAQLAKTYALRARWEGGRLDNAATDQHIDMDAPPLIATDLVSAINGDLTHAVVEQLLAQLRTTEDAATSAYDSAMIALKSAAYAHDGTPERKTGRISPSLVISEVRHALHIRSQGALIENLGIWLEDMAFRTEQYTQLAALAATRAEAETTYALRAQR